MVRENFEGISTIAIIALLFVITVLPGCTTPETSISSPATKTVTDLAGRAVVMPANVTRVAALVGPSYEKIFLLGQTDKIVLMMPQTWGWAVKTNPNITRIPTTSSFQNPNVEDLVSRNVQVVFFWDYHDPVTSMEKAGIPVITGSTSSGNPVSAEEFVNRQKQEMRMYGEVLGPEAKQKADAWCTYFDQKVEYVTSRTNDIPEDKRPTVYYVRGPDVLSTHGRNSNTMWLVEMAGGNYVAKNTTKEGLQTVTMEQVLVWDPEVIFMGRLDNKSVIVDDPKWADIKAVKEGNVYVNPDGVMAWDYGSESVLFMEYIAKILHPDLFQDLNMTTEVKDYYSQFYGYDLTDDEVNRILNHLPPAQ